MSNSENIFGADGQVVQRDIEINIVPDAEGRAKIVPVKGDVIVMSSDGALNRVHGAFQNFHDCGCFVLGAPGVRCAIAGCGKISCPACAKRCTHCLMPICLEHTEMLTVADCGVDLCPRCHAEIRRRRFFGKVAKALLHPFVSTDPRNEP